VEEFEAEFVAEFGVEFVVEFVAELRMRVHRWRVDHHGDEHSFQNAHEHAYVYLTKHPVLPI
jgi:imidazoleglycerol phosphate dehydratase HisB